MCVPSDLGISGRVLVRNTCPDTGKEKIDQRLLRIQKPVARISTLCIHLQTAEERGSFKVNKEEHLSPILGTQSVLENEAKSQLNRMGEDDDPWKHRQEPELLKLVASELGIQTKQIANFELGLFDCQPASLGGIKDEFLYAARLDNLGTCFGKFVFSLCVIMNKYFFCLNDNLAIFNFSRIGVHH